MYCKNCGAPIVPGARFCKKCGTDVPATPTVPPRASILSKMTAALKKTAAALKKQFDRPIFRNRKLLLVIGCGVAAAVLVLILILSIVSCRPKKPQSPDEVLAAVLQALENGDGDTLCGMASLSEPVCGAHPEVFGEGKSPHAIMKAYYRDLAASHCAQWKDAFGKGFALSAQTETEYYTDTSVFEINRALEIDAAQYAVLKGPLLVNGTPVGTISVAAVEWNGAWQLLVVYLY